MHVRAMDFLVELFRNLLEHPDWTMSQACTDSYTKTLKKFHGWLASSSFTVVSLTLRFMLRVQNFLLYPFYVFCFLSFGCFLQIKPCINIRIRYIISYNKTDCCRNYQLHMRNIRKYSFTYFTLPVQMATEILFFILFLNFSTKMSQYFLICPFCFGDCSYDLVAGCHETCS